MKLLALPALADNYIWILHNGQQALVIDPGAHEPVTEFLQQNKLALAAIAITHHHVDHAGGANALYRNCHNSATQVYLPATDGLPDSLFADIAPAAIRRCSQGNAMHVLGLNMQVIDTPGHTAGHIAYFFNAQPQLHAPVLFCGDTLFSAGCGRLFEGTAAQMLQSLAKLAALPANTRVCCAHEYTLANLQFAAAVEPHNTALRDYTAHCQQLRQQHLPTLPSTLAQELAINPFLRLNQPAVQAAAQQHAPSANTPEQLLAALRDWKNTF